MTKKNKINKNINDFYYSEKTFLPLTLYENIFKIYKTTNLNIFKKIYNNLFYGDMICSNIYVEHNWNLQNANGFFSCCMVNYYINENKENLNIDFLREFNKSSLKNINKNKLNKMLSLINNHNLNYDDIFCLSLFYSNFKSSNIIFKKLSKFSKFLYKLYY